MEKEHWWECFCNIQGTNNYVPNGFKFLMHRDCIIYRQGLLLSTCIFLSSDLWESVTKYNSSYTTYTSVPLNTIGGCKTAVTGRDISPKRVSLLFALDKLSRLAIRDVKQQLFCWRTGWASHVKAIEVSITAITETRSFQWDSPLQASK